MVYREILAPGGIDHHHAKYQTVEPVEYCYEGENCGMEEQYAAAVQYDRRRADFLVASEQIDAEGSAVFYDDVHTAQVSIFRSMSMDNIRSGLSGIMPMPLYLPRLRRLEVYLRVSRLGSFRMGFTQRAETGHFTRLCHELAVHCHALKDVSLVLSCNCSAQPPQSGDGTSRYQSHEDVCFTAEEFEILLKPLERVRVSRSLQLKSSCKLLEHLQPVFDRTAILVRSSDPVKELEGNEMIWWQLMEKAGPYFRDDWDFSTSLQMSHEFARVPMWMTLGRKYISESNPALTLEEDCAQQTAFWKEGLQDQTEFLELLVFEAARGKPQGRTPD
ncbi:MAG: hypothetical protein LQ346_003176 [Caloplaca aetnensis]|nr:MAG: hypothetical protein LQ346_003176 [Caloplaca aetnensis]